MKELRKELDKQPRWAKSLIEDVKTSLVWIDKTYREAIVIRQQGKRLPAEIAQRVEMRQRDYLKMVSEMLDNRDFNAAPAVVPIVPIDGSAFNLKNWFKKEYNLIPYCECEIGVHPVNFSVRFKKPRNWWLKTAPKLATGLKVLSAGVKIACAGLPVVMKPELFDTMKNEVEFMKELADHLMAERGAKSNLSSKAKKFVEKQKHGGNISDLRGMATNDEKWIARMELAQLFEEITPKEYKARSGENSGG